MRPLSNLMQNNSFFNTTRSLSRIREDLARSSGITEAHRRAMTVMDRYLRLSQLAYEEGDEKAGEHYAQQHRVASECCSAILKGY